MCVPCDRDGAHQGAAERDTRSLPTSDHVLEGTRKKYKRSQHRCSVPSFAQLTSSARIWCTRWSSDVRVVLSSDVSRLACPKCLTSTDSLIGLGLGEVADKTLRSTHHSTACSAAPRERASAPKARTGHRTSRTIPPNIVTGNLCGLRVC